MVLRRLPDLFNNVKIGQGFTAYNKTYFILPCDLNNLMNTPSNSPVISEKPMFR